MEKAVFIDKDGTLVSYVPYSDPPTREEVLDDKIMYSKVIEGLKHLRSKGFKLIVISNQPWISRKIVTEDEITIKFDELIEGFKKEGIVIDDYYFCPHQGSDGCDCRKPKAGLIKKAAVDHGIDLSASYFIGDSSKDILAGKNAKLSTIFVKTGSGIDGSLVSPDHTIENINGVIEIV